jgi:hypothetical protein
MTEESILQSSFPRELVEDLANVCGIRDTKDIALLQETLDLINLEAIEAIYHQEGFSPDEIESGKRSKRNMKKAYF